MERLRDFRDGEMIGERERSDFSERYDQSNAPTSKRPQDFLTSKEKRVMTKFSLKSNDF